MDGNSLTASSNNVSDYISADGVALRSGVTSESLPNGAALYIVIVIVVYGMSIVFLISAQIYRRPNKMIEDRQINKYLKEFQVFKERSSRDSYRHLKTIVVAKLYRQDHMGSHGSGVGSRREGQRPDGLYRTLGRTVGPLSAAVRMPLEVPRLTLDIALANEWGAASEASRSSAGKHKRDCYIYHGLSSSRSAKCTCENLYVIEEHPASAQNEELQQVSTGTITPEHPPSAQNEEMQQVSTGTITPPLLQCTCELTLPLQCTCEQNQVNEERAYEGSEGESIQYEDPWTKGHECRPKNTNMEQRAGVWTKDHESRDQTQPSRNSIRKGLTASMKPNPQFRQSVKAEICGPRIQVGQPNVQKQPLLQTKWQQSSQRGQSQEKHNEPSREIERAQFKPYIHTSEAPTLTRKLHVGQSTPASVHAIPSRLQIRMDSEESIRHPAKVRTPIVNAAKFRGTPDVETHKDYINVAQTSSDTNMVKYPGKATPLDKRISYNEGTQDRTMNSRHSRNADVRGGGEATQREPYTVAFSEDKHIPDLSTGSGGEHALESMQSVSTFGSRGILASHEERPTVHVSCV